MTSLQGKMKTEGIWSKFHGVHEVHIYEYKCPFCGRVNVRYHKYARICCSYCDTSFIISRQAKRTAITTKKIIIITIIGRNLEEKGYFEIAKADYSNLPAEIIRCYKEERIKKLQDGN